MFHHREVVLEDKGIVQEQGPGQAEKEVKQKRNTHQHQVADESKRGWYNLRGVKFKLPDGWMEIYD
jgi:hypothetical protein